MIIFKIRTLGKLLILGCCLSFTINLPAQTTAINDSSSNFKFGLTERLRIETGDNYISLSKSAKAGASYNRVRSSFTADWIPDESFDFALKLTHEFRTYYAPSTNNFYMNEVFFDQLYIKWKTDIFLNGTLTLGRQNITLGEGFLISEGTPLDGSRSAYFNAARYDLNINKNNFITFFGSYSPKQDKLLPVINGNDIDLSCQADGTFTLSEQNEAAGGIYYTGINPNFNLQSYYILKSYIDPDKSLKQVNSNVHTVGSRLNTSLTKSLSTTIEGAYQFGSYGTYKRSAYGGYWYFDLASGWKQSFLPTIFTVGTVCLSGDKPGTSNMEGWDPVYSRYPKWSDSYVYTFVHESKIGYWSNIISFYSSIKFAVSDNMKFNFDYHHMLAPQAGTQTTFLSGNGNVRGDLFIGKFTFNISKTVSGRFIWEHFMPGNFYFGGADPYNWSQMEFTFNF
jgi:hypothetical protein